MSSVSSAALLAVILLAAAPIALATGNPPHNSPPAKSPAATSVAGAVSGSASKSASNSAAKSVSAADSHATSNSDSHSDSNSQSSSNNANDSSASLSAEYHDRLQAPAVSAPPVYASGPCAYGWSAGLSVPGGGLSGGKSRPDVACDRRELVRVLTPLNPWLALKVACEDPLVVDMRLRNLASVEDCRYVPPAQPERVVTAPLPPSKVSVVTKEEAQSMVDRAFKQSASK